MKIIFATALALLGSTLSVAQTDSISVRSEISFTIDNDILFFLDRYYTAGHEFSYRRLLTSDHRLAQWLDHKKQPSKVIVSYQLGNKIFTPKKVRFVNTINMDRPYAGYMYGDFSIQRLKGLATVSNFTTEVGLIGEMTGLGQLQAWWHERTGFQEPRGWDSQIANEVVINVSYQYQKSIPLGKEIDLVSSSEIVAGTGSNKLSQDISFRLIDFSPLTQSVFSNSLLGFEGSAISEEVFIFFGCGVDYIISNIFLEGSLFTDNPSPFTVEATPWVMRRNFGIMYARNHGAFSINFINIGKEMIGGLRHNYMSFAFSVRF